MFLHFLFQETSTLSDQIVEESTPVASLNELRLQNDVVTEQEGNLVLICRFFHVIQVSYHKSFFLILLFFRFSSGYRRRLIFC